MAASFSQTAQTLVSRFAPILSHPSALWLWILGDLHPWLPWAIAAGLKIAASQNGEMQDDPRWNLADPICTFLFAFLVLLTTRAIIRDISDILMERVPRALDAEAISDDLEKVRQLSLLTCSGKVCPQPYM